jgi:serine/threonine protein kinase
VSDDPLVGTFVGRYRIERLLARGGMGHVYAALQPEIGSRTAIKILDEKATEDPELVERFFAEARAINLIAHENIVKVLDLAWLDDGRPYIVMEFIDGVTVTQAARGGRAPLGGIVRVIADVLSALAAAHERGIVHRDLKPDNILITAKGHAKVVDFGIAKLAPDHLHPEAARTATGALLGTPAYMAPEQVSGARDVDARTDVYAAGAVLFFACVGRPPFTGATMYDLMRAQLEEPPPSPRSSRPDLPPSLEHVILTALAKDPAQRYQSAAEMSAALDACADDLADEHWVDLSPRDSGRETPAAMSVVAMPATKSRRWMFGAMAAVALAAVLIVFPMTRSSPRRETAADKPTPIADAMSIVDATSIIDLPSIVDIPSTIDLPSTVDASVALARPKHPRVLARQTDPLDTATPDAAVPDAAMTDAPVYVVKSKVEIPNLPDDQLTAEQLQAKYRVPRAARPKHDVPTPDVPYAKYIDGSPHDFDVVRYVDRAAEHVATIPTPKAGKPELLKVRVIFARPDGVVDVVRARVEYTFRLASATAVGCVAVVIVASPRTLVWVEPGSRCTGQAIAKPKCNPSQVYASQIASQIRDEGDGIDRRPTEYTFDGNSWKLSSVVVSSVSDSCM